MAILSSIRRWHFRDGVSIREIGRRTGLSRNTIKKYLSNAVVDPRYPKRRTPSKLDAYAGKLVGWLKSEASKGRKQRRSLKQIHADLVQLGFAGSYGRVAAFARGWRQTQQLSQGDDVSRHILMDVGEHMNGRCISQNELAQRWQISESTLERWRSKSIGPVFLKLRGQVRYRDIDISSDIADKPNK